MDPEEPVRNASCELYPFAYLSYEDANRRMAVRRSFASLSNVSVSVIRQITDTLSKIYRACLRLEVLASVGTGSLVCE